MDTAFMMMDVAAALVAQVQKPTLAFLLGGMVLAALSSRLEVPEAIYKWIVTDLLLKVGLSAGISVRSADLAALAVPALGAAVIGIAIARCERYRRRGAEGLVPGVSVNRR